MLTLVLCGGRRGQSTPVESECNQRGPNNLGPETQRQFLKADAVCGSLVEFVLTESSHELFEQTRPMPFDRKHGIREHEK